MTTSLEEKMSHFVQHWIATACVRLRRLRRDEAGVTTIEWLGLGAMMLIVLVGLSPAVRNLAGDVIDFFREQILGQG